MATTDDVDNLFIHNASHGPIIVKSYWSADFTIQVTNISVYRLKQSTTMASDSVKKASVREDQSTVLYQDPRAMCFQVKTGGYFSRDSQLITQK